MIFRLDVHPCSFHPSGPPNLHYQFQWSGSCFGARPGLSGLARGSLNRLHCSPDPPYPPSESLSYLPQATPACWKVPVHCTSQCPRVATQRQRRHYYGHFDGERSACKLNSDDNCSIRLFRQSLSLLKNYCWWWRWFFWVFYYRYYWAF